MLFLKNICIAHKYGETAAYKDNSHYNHFCSRTKANISNR
eukprot:SAG31_NODE_20401_length_575_cov_10.294118_2_plen_39_part_01